MFQNESSTPTIPPFVFGVKVPKWIVKNDSAFQIGSGSSKMNSELQLLLFDLGTKTESGTWLPLFVFGAEVPKQIVRNWLPWMTIGFGVATANKWSKSTRTLLPDSQFLYVLCYSHSSLLMATAMRARLVHVKKDGTSASSVHATSVYM